MNTLDNVAICVCLQIPVFVAIQVSDPVRAEVNEFVSILKWMLTNVSSFSSRPLGFCVVR